MNIDELFDAAAYLVQEQKIAEKRSAEQERQWTIADISLCGLKITLRQELPNADEEKPSMILISEHISGCKVKISKRRRGRRTPY